MVSQVLDKEILGKEVVLSSSCLDNLGIYFYDEYIVQLREDMAKDIKSYKFKLKLTTEYPYLDNYYNSEPIEVIKTTSLWDLPQIDNPVDKDDKCTEKIDWFDVDFEKFLLENFPNEFEYHLNRLTRKISDTPVAPIFYDTSWQGYSEFLEFTEDTAHNWAGPFELNNKLGCHASIRKGHPVTIDTTMAKFVDVFWSMSLGLEMYIEVFGKDRDYKIPNSEFIKDLPLEKRVEICNRFLKSHSHGTDAFDEMLPYRLYLCGNDDCSYTKYFASEEAATKELEWLRKLQPLDFQLDIAERGYHFTN